MNNPMPQGGRRPESRDPGNSRERKESGEERKKCSLPSIRIPSGNPQQKGIQAPCGAAEMKSPEWLYKKHRANAGDEIILSNTTPPQTRNIGIPTMKLPTILAAGIAAIAALISTTANAAELPEFLQKDANYAGRYVGFGISQTDADVNAELCANRTSTGEPRDNEKCDEKSAGGKLFYGRTINRHYGFEIGLTYHGEVKETTTTSSTTNSTPKRTQSQEHPSTASPSVRSR